MPTVVLLRGVNVGGHRTFRPAALAEQLSHFDAVNIGAAGTFVFRRPPSRARLRAELARRLPFETEMVMCKGRDIVAMCATDRFADHPDRPDIVRFVSVLARTPRSTMTLPMGLPVSGEWLVRLLAREGRFVFGVYRRHMKAVGYLGKIDAIFGVPATTRNWNTIAAIARVIATDSMTPPRK
jgi:uncharacterized protein (DUF1697 family)